jgi:membrane protease YdiL (CAAX protease family)
MDQRLSAVRWKRVAIFYAVVYLTSYGSVGAFLATGGSFRDASWVFFAQLTSLAPALVGICLTRFLWHEPVKANLALRLPRTRWTLLAWLLAWLLVLLALLGGLCVPGVTWDRSLQPAVVHNLVSPDQLALLHRLSGQLHLPPFLFLIPLGALSSVTMSLVAGCGEEVGWRGFLYGELQPLGFWKNATVTGLFWLGWHIPLLAFGYGYPQHPGFGVLLLSSHVMVSAYGLAYLRERSGSSVVAGLFHGTTEAAALLAVAPLAGGSDLTVGIGSIGWIAADALIVIGLFAYDAFLAKEPIAFRKRDEGSTVLRS